MSSTCIITAFVAIQDSFIGIDPMGAMYNLLADLQLLESSWGRPVKGGAYGTALTL